MPEKTTQTTDMTPARQLEFQDEFSTNGVTKEKLAYDEVMKDNSINTN